MAKVAVYHMSRQAFRNGLDSVGRMVNHDPEKALAMVLEAIDQYDYVARVKTRSDVVEEALEQVWRDTNNIDHPWCENESIIYSKNGSSRSSMVGDIFVIRDNGYPSAYVVANFGFTRLQNAEAVALKLDQSYLERNPI